MGDLNGSPVGIASSLDLQRRSRHHPLRPERVLRTGQLSWHRRDWGNQSLWPRMFRNGGPECVDGQRTDSTSTGAASVAADPRHCQHRTFGLASGAH